MASKVLLRKTGEPWTPERVRGYGLTMPGVDACECVYNLGRTTALDRLRNGDVDFRVLRRGRSFRVPTIDVLRLLGLEHDAEQAEAIKSAPSVELAPIGRAG